ncbi:hypothetical protein ACFOEK_17675 [Litoribrevibacter euphylliae]|uniref:Tetratricopeptide repeat protein n=1 Tax=Litoribrevibacter euphylliae TaxID=1834034 RepID=A0ABV7HJS3_9GAMM
MIQSQSMIRSLVLLLILAFSALTAVEVQAKNSMRPAMYKRIVEIQKGLSPEAPEGSTLVPEVDKKAVRTLIDEFLDHSPNDYEASLVYQYSASLSLLDENYKAAYQDYKKVHELNRLPLKNLLQIEQALGQLAMQNEAWKTAIGHIEQWMKNLSQAQEQLKTEGKLKDPILNEKIIDKDYMMLAQAHNQLEQWPEVVVAIDQALALHAEPVAPESWYRMRLAGLLSQFNALTETKPKSKPWWSLHLQSVQQLQLLVTHFPNMNYWRQLASMYQQAALNAKENSKLSLDSYTQALSTLHSAYVAGYLSTEQDHLWMLRLMVHQGKYHQAGRILEKALKDKVVSDANEHLKMLADVWVMSREYSKAETTLKALIAKSNKASYQETLADVQALLKAKVQG